MRWFSWLPRKKRAHPPEQFTVQEIDFVGEQDGPPEQMLKSWLIQLLSGSEVERAYLAKVRYENASGVEGEIEVALCTRAAFPDQRLLKGISELFAAVFRTDSHLDILLLTDEQENRLRGVCRSFWP